jgi:hypothetical protein
MANLARAVRPGGLLLIAGPNVLSIKGAATKLTPYWLHRLYYRRNQPHLAPFRTYLRVATSPKLMARWADRRGLTVAYAGTYESGMQVALRRRLRWTGATWSIFERIARALTMGFFEPAATDFVFLFRRAA